MLRADKLCAFVTQADSLIYQTEKQLKDLGDKVPADVKSKVESQIESLKQTAGSDDTEATKKAIEDLQKEVRTSCQIESLHALDLHPQLCCLHAFN